MSIVVSSFHSIIIHLCTSLFKKFLETSILTVFKVNMEICIYALVCNLSTDRYKTFYLSIQHAVYFKKIVFYSGRDASYPKIWFLIHSHNSCHPLRDCRGRWDWTQNCCVAVWFTQSCLSQLSHHIPMSHYIPKSHHIPPATTFPVYYIQYSAYSTLSIA
jgi:hypothetical protein